MWWFNRVGLCGWVGSEFVGEGGDRGAVLRELDPSVVLNLNPKN
jgi:hypothetical protein